MGARRRMKSLVSTKSKKGRTGASRSAPLNYEKTYERLSNAKPIALKRPISRSKPSIVIVGISNTEAGAAMEKDVGLAAPAAEGSSVWPVASLVASPLES